MATDPYRYFRVEARELIEGMGQGILVLEQGSADETIIPRLLRHAHTLKGAARVVRQLEIADLSHQLEEVLSVARAVGRSVSASEARDLLANLDRMSAALARLEPAPPAQDAAPAPAPAPPTAVDDTFQTVRVEIEEMDAVLRAVTETGVQLSALKRELGRLRQLTSLSAALTSQLELREATGRGAAAAKEQGLAVDLQAGLERVLQALDAGVERVDQELADVRDGADRLRLVPAQSLFPALVRGARDAAQALGKRVEVQLTGGALRLDAHVLAPLRDALLHLVRNAVAHGIESPSERATVGKAPTGLIRLGVERRGRRVVFTCKDDGKGIDLQAIRRELSARGAMSPAEAATLPDRVVLERLLSLGFTTSVSVTQISGRGVGLDVVRETAAQLKGDVEILSEPGQGTSVELAVPVSLSALKALVVEVGATVVAIPLDSVRETLRLLPGSIARSPRGDSVAQGGKVIPFLPLARALRRTRKSDSRATWSAVVVAVGEQSAAVGVDRLRGTFDVVVRPLPSAVDADPVVAGASLDAEGHPQLLLDVAGLLALAENEGGAATAPELERLPILVIDDSLTTRMLEQSILESAGYEVELAVSAEQGLEKAREKRYGLFIVDVEMPGMDGFEFVARTRADPDLARVSAILVTSRGSPEDQRRGEQAGASAYIVKGEFDQNELLGHIRRLLGARAH